MAIENQSSRLCDGVRHSAALEFASAHDAYSEPREQMFSCIRGAQRGDPRATAEAILQVVDAERPPLRFIFGDDTLPRTRAAYEDRLATWEAWASDLNSAHGVSTESLAAWVANVARDLGMRERTLQRRITDEGATLRALLVEARQELDRRLLSDVSTGIEEVACLLGYHDTSSFYRGFNDWEGVTPNRWRALNAATAPDGGQIWVSQ